MMPRERSAVETQPMEVPVLKKYTSAAMKILVARLKNSSERLKLHLKHYHMSPAQFRHRTCSLRLPEDVHDRYKEVVQGCEHCVKSKPPLQRSKVTGLRADNCGDIVFLDNADVKIRSETYTVLIVVDGATSFVAAFAPRTKDSHETAQCLMEWMDTVHCTPQSVLHIWFSVS